MKITWQDKVKVKESGLPAINSWRDVDIAEVKEVVNDNSDRVTALEEGGEGSLPIGGTTSQVLAKKSDSDYDVEWKDGGTGGGGTALTTTTDVTNFDKNLSAADTDVQKALQTFNDADLGGTTIEEIKNTAITFKELKSWVNSTLSSFSIDLTGAKNGATTIAVFNSDTDPVFSEIPGVDRYYGDLWSINKHFLLQFEYFNNEVNLNVTSVQKDFDPLDLASLVMFLDVKDNSSLTIETGNLISEIRDLTVNNNNFSNTLEAERPLLKRQGMFFDGVDNKLTASRADITFGNASQGEVIVVAAKKEYKKNSYVLNLYDAGLNEYIYMGYVSFNNVAAGNRFTYFDSKSVNKIYEDKAYLANENLRYNIYNIISDGSFYRMYKNGVQVDLIVETGSNNGDWFNNLLDADEFGIHSLDTVNTYGEIASLEVLSSPMTEIDRLKNNNYLERRFFGMENPINYGSQYVTPILTYNNEKYNWGGGISKNPINEKVVSVWDEGADHHVSTRSVECQISDDDGVSYGVVHTVIASTATDGYGSVSMGHGSDGRLHCLIKHLDFTGGEPVNLGLISTYSDDDGVTWSTPVVVTGVTPPAFSLGKILNGTDGYLYTSAYETNLTDYSEVFVTRSIDNGVSWSKYSTIELTNYTDEYINETDMLLIAPNTMLAMTRVEGRNYYNQYISTDNGLNWNKQGTTNLSDWWTDDTTGASNDNVNPVKIDSFSIDGIDCVGYMYFNRGVGLETGDSYIRVGVARADDLISQGVNGWADASSVEIKINGISLEQYDGYCDLRFLNNDNNIYFRLFHEYAGSFPNSDVNILYCNYELPTNWVKAVLNI